VAKWLEWLFNGPCLTDVGCSFKLIKKKSLKKIENKKHPSYADLKRVDEETRALANKLVMKGGY
jgi:hypothetical protein